MSADVTISLRARGAARAAADVDRVSSSVGRLGRVSHSAGRGLGTLGTGTARTAGSGLAYVGDKAKYATSGLLGVGGAAGVMGLKFNAGIEQTEVAFTNFLGSGAAARREIAALQTMAKTTPFELPELTTGAQRLLGFQFGLKETNSWLRTIGDTAAGTGKGAEAIDRITTAIGQIKAKGRVQGEELMQLQELGLPVNDILRKRLGLTREQVADIGNENISATRALRALQQGFDDLYGGQSKAHSKTFTGQWSTLRDNVRQTSGLLTMPAFNWLRRDAFPGLNKGLENFSETLTREDIDFAEKLKLGRTQLRTALDPLTDEIEREIREMQLGRRLSEQFEEHAPEVANALGQLGWNAAKAFGQMWWEAGPLGKFATAGYLGMKLGLTGPVFGALGSHAAGQFRGSFIGNKGAEHWTRLGNRVGGLTGAGFAAGLIAGIVIYRDEITKTLEDLPIVKQYGDVVNAAADQLGIRPNEAALDAREAGTRAIANPEGRQPIGPGSGSRGGRAGRAAPPVRERVVVENHNTLLLDSKVVARAVERVLADKKARR